MVDKQYQGVLLVIAGLLVITTSFHATGIAQLFAIIAGLALVVWGILWQR